VLVIDAVLVLDAVLVFDAVDVWVPVFDGVCVPV
jgi:hypothetical protein